MQEQHALNRCKVTLVAFVRFFSRMNFQMCSQIVCSNRCKVTLSSQMDCLNRFKVLLSEPQYLPHLLLEGSNSGPRAQIAFIFLPIAQNPPFGGGMNEQPPWTREQSVLPAEVVAPTPLIMGAAISVGGEAQIVRLGVKMIFPSSSSWYHCEKCEFKPKKKINQSLLSM